MSARVAQATSASMNTGAGRGKRNMVDLIPTAADRGGRIGKQLLMTAARDVSIAQGVAKYFRHHPGDVPGVLPARKCSMSCTWRAEAPSLGDHLQRAIYRADPWRERRAIAAWGGALLRRNC